jgi:hypothetical protein
MPDVFTFFKRGNVMQKARFYLLSFAITLLFASSADAKLFGLVSQRGTSVASGLGAGDSSSRAVVGANETSLYEIDPDTGQATLIGGTGFFLCTGMDFHPVTRVLYAVCAPDNIFKSVQTVLQPDFYLVRIDIRTGAATPIGITGVLPSGLGPIADISFRSDGTLFGTAGKGTITLGTFDLKTGLFTQIGPAVVDAQAGGLAFSPSDVLYSADTSFDASKVLLQMLDQATGGANFIANLNLQLNQDQFPDVTSMDTNPADGLLYAYLFDQSLHVVFSSDTSTQKSLETPEIVTIDPKTGDVEFRASTIDGVTAIAFLDEARNIPTMGEWDLIILAACLLLGSMLVLRRRPRKGII